VRVGRLHVVTDDEVLARPDFAAVAERVLAAGGEVCLHLRGHGTGGGSLFELAARLVTAAHAAGAQVVVNDRVDIALAAGADGVQLGRRGLPVSRVRPLVAGRLLGYSAHAAVEAAEAAAAGADFVVIGTIFDTPAHPAPAAGVGLVRETAAAVSVPVLAIGGITPARVAEVVGAGASGVAVRGAIWDATDPESAVVAFEQALGASRVRGA
jgi:thiamine-phosphate pyrophosphorylase